MDSMSSHCTKKFFVHGECFLIPSEVRWYSAPNTSTPKAHSGHTIASRTTTTATSGGSHGGGFRRPPVPNNRAATQKPAAPRPKPFNPPPVRENLVELPRLSVESDSVACCDGHMEARG